MPNASASPEVIQTGCAIVGGGPAGMMLGFLLARAGVEVVVLEKHADFLRDFRGDTIHPSTLELIYELGLLDEFRKRPHQEVQELQGKIGDFEATIADFRYVKTHCKCIALMPQWDFLNFLVEHGSRYPTFHVRMQTEVTDVIEENGNLVGVRATTPSGPLEIRAKLTVGCDGRHSTIRAKVGFKVHDFGAPMDVLWMHISRKATDPFVPLGRFDRGRILVLIFRDEYWQCGFVIPKGGYDEIRKQGIEAFRQQITEIAPFLADRVSELTDWDHVRLLTVGVDRLKQWYRPGLLCIGDAAHTMSPVGGVGINLAIQDAVATANLLAEPLRRGTMTIKDLARVQKRRMFPTRFTQRLQVLIQDRVINRALTSQKMLKPPCAVRMLKRFPRLRRIPARIIGIGVRPEHVHTPDAFAKDGQPTVSA